MKKVLSAILSVMIVFGMMLGVTGCGAASSPEKSIEKFFNNYAVAITTENITDYMACIDAGSSEINITAIRTAMENVFQTYDLAASIENVVVNKVDETSATATVTIKYENRGVIPYVDNRVVGIYELVKKDDKWLITSSTMQSVEYLDGTPASIDDLMYSVPADEANDGELQGVSEESETTESTTTTTTQPPETTTAPEQTQPASNPEG